MWESDTEKNQFWKSHVSGSFQILLIFHNKKALTLGLK